MLKNHIKIAFRNLLNRKSYAIINIVGLSLGLWCTLLIGLWIVDEFNKDSFHTNGDRISLVMSTFVSDDGIGDTWGGTGYPVGEALAENFPDIENVVRTSGPREAVSTVDENTISTKVLAADAYFFELFSFPLLEGNPEDCLKNSKNVVLSEEKAKLFFPNESAIGKTVNLMLDETMEPYMVSGIFKKLPEQSTLQYDAVVPLANFLPMNNKSWGNTWVNTYILSRENSNIKGLSQKLKNIPKEVGGDANRILSLQALKDRYLYSKFENGVVVGGRIDNVILFGIIAIFTLLIACFNFINLTTAWAIKRSKEVGIKKVLGAGRLSLLSQFFVESIVLVFVAVLISVALAYLSMPLFNSITEKSLAIGFFNLQFYAIVIGIATATVLLSGIYPAYSMANLNGKTALHQKIKGNTNETVLRKGLVIFQFFLCMAMITGTIVVYFQLDYIQNKNLGLDKENIIYMSLDGKTIQQLKAVKSELENFSGIESVSLAGSNFIDMGGSTQDPTWEGRAANDGVKSFSIINFDFGLLEMLKLDVVAGRSFSKQFANDTLNYIVNESAAKLMGVKNPIGKFMSFWGDEGGKIVGVVKDFHFNSLHNPISPMIIRCRPSETWLLYAKTIPGNTQSTIAKMQEVHEQFSELPFSYHFLDEAIENGYQEEQKIQLLSSIFAFLAIVISCLGLFGLALFTANQRIKEIAVRKILGANVPSLFKLLSKDFIKLVGLALLIAIPVSWFVMNNWIQTFAFHITIKWWMFGIASLLLMGIALITVSFQTFKVAHKNPSKSLRMNDGI
ncbi:FtsX-like permease family protein [Aurantibacter sp.]|uniref:ABC transporter permease n=1 Tax=Aurantibacter sp. TaxID=2807103 RepID=UPI003265C85B